jgi:hypothetical protein
MSEPLFVLCLLGAIAAILHRRTYPWVIVAGVLTTALTIWPLGAIRILRRYVTVGVVLSLLWFAWFFLTRAPEYEGGSWTAFAPAVDYVIALSVSWVPMAADFARHSRSSGAAFTGVVGGYTLAQVACLGLGVYAVAMAGCPVCVPGTAASPTMAVPIRLPTTTAISAADTLSGASPSGLSRNNAPEKPRRLTPRFAQSAPWSSTPRVLGASPSRVSGTSSATCVIAHSLRRHYPDRFRRSAADLLPSQPGEPRAPATI